MDRSRRIWLGLGLLTVFGLPGCSVLPTAGPTADAVVVAGDNEQERRYVVADIDDRVVSILASLPGPSFRARFGDYRPSPENLIGVGDEIRIVIYEAAAGGLFSPPISAQLGGSRSATIPDQVVGRDGAITVPYAGRINVVGQTQQDVEQTVVQRLIGKAIDPQVLVTVSRNLANSVTITGEVTNGARVPLSARGDRVLDAVAAAGGVRGLVSETFVRLTRGRSTATVPLETMLAHPEENVFLRGGDVLTLVREPQTFTAFGALLNNTAVPFGRIDLSLEEGVAKAGGLLDARADPDGVFLLRFEPPATVAAIAPDRGIDRRERLIPVVYRLSLRDPKSYFLARSFKMRDKDVIYAANASGAELQKFFTLVSTIAQPIVTGVAAASR